MLRCVPCYRPAVSDTIEVLRPTCGNAYLLSSNTPINQFTQPHQPTTQFKYTFNQRTSSTLADSIVKHTSQPRQSTILKNHTIQPLPTSQPQPQGRYRPITPRVSRRAHHYSFIYIRRSYLGYST